MCRRMCDDVCTADLMGCYKGKADTQDCKAWVDEQLSEMSLKEKIGQLFIHTVAPLQTQRNKNNIYAAIKEYKVGGLLFRAVSCLIRFY